MTEKLRFSNQQWSYVIVIHVFTYLSGDPQRPDLFVWLLYFESQLLPCLRTFGYSLVEHDQQNRRQAIYIQQAPRSGRTMLFSTSFPANESLPQTQIISLCLSFTFYKVGIMIAIPPYFVSILWVENIVHVSLGEERLKWKHHYFSRFSANSLHGNQSFLLRRTLATSGLVT